MARLVANGEAREYDPHAPAEEQLRGCTYAEGTEGEASTEHLLEELERLSAGQGSYRSIEVRIRPKARPRAADVLRAADEGRRSIERCIDEVAGLCRRG